MKHKSPLPISLDNWKDLKGKVPGLTDASRGAYRSALYTPLFGPGDITTFREEIGVMHQEAVEILDRHGLRMLTLREALYALTNYQQLWKQLKVLRLSDIGTDLHGEQVIQGDYTLKKLDKDSPKDPERSIFVLTGGAPLVITINSDEYTAQDGDRFILDGTSAFPTSSNVAGIPKSIPIL